MYFKDLFQLTLSTFESYRMRSFLTGLGIAIGVAAVILLTSIGEGLHQFVLSEFSQFGTNIIAIQPGKTQTHGGASMGAIGSAKQITIDDAESLRKLPYVQYVVPVLTGNAEVRADGRSRRTLIIGVNSDVPKGWKMNVQVGQFLPPDDPSSARAMAVLGTKVRDELFGSSNPLGEYVRIGGERYRVVGIMESKGQMLGFDMDDAVYIPTGRAMELFNREGVEEIDVTYQPSASAVRVKEGIRQIMVARHGREDFTLISQEEALEVLGSVLEVITFAVGALGGISLLVGGVGILTIMTMAVSERTGEIGLLRALGARRQQVMLLFLGEAALLAAAGGIAGLAIGIGIAYGLHFLVPSMPVHMPMFYIVVAEITAVVIGLIAGVMPARRAAQMDPVDALRTE